MRICGIDPGSNGAICVLDRNDSTYIAFCDLKMSTTYDIAKKLYPNVEIHGKRGGLLDGRSDACMVAYYGLTH